MCADFPFLRFTRSRLFSLQLALEHRTFAAIHEVDRDAYQQDLRTTPTNRSALRFDIQWKARGYDELTLRIDLKGMKGKEPTQTNLQQRVAPNLITTPPR